MVLAKTSNGIISIHGRFGGVYFKAGKDGQHIQAMPRIVKYVRSPAQIGSAWTPTSPAMGGIAGYTQAAALWIAVLVASAAYLWIAFAALYLFIKGRDKPKKITGYNWYIHYALAYPELGRPPYWKPPNSPTDLPHLMTLYKGLWTYNHPETEWPAECGSGYYYRGETWNGKTSYHRDDQMWFLWWHDPEWIMSRGLGIIFAGITFYSEDPFPISTYHNPDTGSFAVVVLGSTE